VVGPVVQREHRLVLGWRRAAQEPQRLPPDRKRERSRERRVHRHVEFDDVLREDGGRRADLFPVVDEPSVDVLGRVVVDHHVDRRSGRHLVVRAGHRVIDERQQMAIGAALHHLRIERLKIEVEQIDERAVLLVGYLSAVEDAPLVDAGRGGDTPQRERARQAVRIGVVVTHDGERVGVGERIVQRPGTAHRRHFDPST